MRAFSTRWVQFQYCSQNNQWRGKISAEPGFEPGAAWWEARMLPLSYECPLPLSYEAPPPPSNGKRYDLRKPTDLFKAGFPGLPHPGEFLTSARVHFSGRETSSRSLWKMRCHDPWSRSAKIQVLGGLRVRSCNLTHNYGHWGRLFIITATFSFNYLVTQENLNPESLQRTLSNLIFNHIQ